MAWLLAGCARGWGELRGGGLLTIVASKAERHFAAA
jgi:hypothetical protein